MPNNPQTYSITYSNPQSITVEDYLNNENTVVHIYHGKANQFLNIIGYDGISNRQRIEQSYKTADEKRYIGAAYNKLLIKSGIILYIEYDKVNSPNFVTQGIEVVSNDEPAFKAAALAKLEADEGYIQAFGNGVKESYPDVTVWIWCRALSDNMNENELKGQFLDLTPFVSKLSTSMNKNGGNFQLTLPPLICELDQKKDKWILKQDTITQFTTDKGAPLQNFGYVSEGDLFDNNGNRNQFYLNNAIKSNDLIFIRFETLEMEKEQRYSDSKRFYIDKSMIANTIYDMIGLVDSTELSLNAASNDVTIRVTGRDLSSLFIDDGTYAYALENSQGVLKIAGGTRVKGNSLIDRIYADGGLLFLKLFMQNSIEYIIKFIIQQLSNIKVVPNDLFTSYGDRRNTKIDVINKNAVENNGFKPQYKEELANGIWQIVKLVIDESVTGRTLCDSSMSTANGSLINFFRIVCQEPLVEMYMDTYNDQYHLIVRKPPYDQKGITTLINGRVNTETGAVETPPAIVTISQEDVLDERLEMNNNQVYSWFQFFPRNALINNKVDYSLSILPAVFFEEYGQVFGSRAFCQSHNYIAFNPKSDSKSAIWDKQVYYDLKYVIESNQYLPFSRKGTLVLNGDRRIKIGNIIRYNGEIFFVTSVQQNFNVNGNSIDRTTIINVERGLNEQLIYGVNYADENGVEKYVSYFNIIDTTLTLNNITTTRTETITELLNNNTSGENIYPGFGEYMEHQQGIGGSHIIAKGYLNNTPANRFNKQILKNMAANVEGDFVGELNPVSFINYWIKRYNKNYVLAQIKINSYEDLYQTVCKDNGVPVDVIKTFGQIESNNKGLVSLTTTHRGIMQISNEIADSYKLSNTDVKDSITMACRLYKQYNKDNPFLFLYQDSNGEIQQPQTKEVTKTYKETHLDYDAVFNKFKVNKFSFNFFLKNLQFDPAYKTVRSRDIKSPDGSLPDVIVTGKRKIK